MRFRHRTVPVVLLSLASINSALACSCARNPTAAGLLESSTAVFTGVAGSSTPAEPGVSVTTFRVTESFKGVREGRVVRVRHPSGSSASCGVRFESGKAHTLAVSGNASGYSASLCSAWMFLPHAGISDNLIEQMRALRRR